MAKEFVSKGKGSDPKPTIIPACEDCKFVKDWNERKYCDFRFPPHVGLDDHPRARLVGHKHYCDLFQRK